jgi:hypothetical protein
VSAPHGVPGKNFAAHTPPEQNLPAPHVASTVHPPPHRVPLQTWGAQSCSCTGPHAPSPAQVRTSLATPVAQLAGVQTVVVPGYVQLLPFTPSQVPAHSGSMDTHAGRTPRGGPFAATHVPGESVTSQASHWPLHASSQQTPSTQYDEAHSDTELHFSPLRCCLVHFPARQNSLMLQAASVVQSSPHRSPTQALPQSMRSASGHLPVPWQYDATVAIPLSHAGSLHCTPGPG